MRAFDFLPCARRWSALVVAASVGGLSIAGVQAQTVYPSYGDGRHALAAAGQVRIVDRDTGDVLPFYRRNGELWVAGRPGARYGISIMAGDDGRSNRSEAVVTVDGINVITGQTASLQQTGYVIDNNQWQTITGWRKSDSEVASFHFTALPRSYAARTGRPDNVGVIGVAFYRERPRPQPVPEITRRWHNAPPAAEDSARYRDSWRGDGADAAAAAPSAKAQDERAPYRSRAETEASRLGTGHGAREGSEVTYTTFERRSSQPEQIITIRYDSYDNLVEMGIIPRPRRYRPGVPQPFPQSSPRQYVPDPPRW